MSRTFDPFDELAAMFLTTPQAADLQEAIRVVPSRVASPQLAQPSLACPSPVSSSKSPAIVELLIAGHLPVRGGLWLTPYADALARATGPTALVRLDSEEAMLQLLDPTSDGQPLLDYPSLEKAIAAQGSINTWIVRAAAGTPWADVAASPVDRFTILTSADEAAIVAAYQIIKDLAEASLQINRRLNSVGLAVVAVDQSTAKAAVERLNRTTRSFLEVEVKLVMCLPRIDAGLKSSRCMLFAGQPTPSLAQVLHWTNQVKAMPRLPEPVNHSIAGKLYADRETEVLHAADLLQSPHENGHSIDAPAPLHSLKATLPMPSPFIAPPSRTPPESFAPPAPKPSPPLVAQDEPRPAPTIQTSTEFYATPIKLAPKPSAQVEAKAQANTIEPDDRGKPVPLSSFVAGLMPLPIRCPNHERIEIAVDHEGRLHLLGRESLLRDMPVVEGWTKSHRELIAMACPQHPINHSHKTVSHVFTAEPASLADLHGSELRLHVLAPVVLNGQTAWYAAPLNK